MKKAGTVSRGIVYPSVVRLAFFGMAGLVRSGGRVEARIGRRGKAGEASIVKDGTGRRVWVSCGKLGRGRARNGRKGLERRGVLRNIPLWNGRQGGVWYALSRKVSEWQVWQVQDGCGGERNGMAGKAANGILGCVAVRNGVVWRFLAGEDGWGGASPVTAGRGMP